jgi:hypothetical protein
MKVGYGTEEWVTCILITLSKSVKEKQSKKSPDHETNQHFMQALPTRKSNKDQVQIKGIFNNKTTGNCAY